MRTNQYTYQENIIEQAIYEDCLLKSCMCDEIEF